MSNGAFLYTSATTGIVPTCTGSDSGYAIGSIYDGNPSTVHKYTAAAQVYEWNAGSGNTISASAFSIHNHNLLATATVRVEFSNDHSDWGDAFSQAYMILGVDMYWVFSMSRIYRYWRITITPAASYAITIGEICLWSNYHLLVRNYNWGYDEINVLYAQQNNFWGQNVRSKISQGIGYNLSFDNVLAANKAILATIAKESAVVFIPDQAVNQCYHGMIQGDGLKSKVNPSGYSFQMTFLENCKRT